MRWRDALRPSLGRLEIEMLLHDEPVSVLLARTRAEREQIIEHKCKGSTT